MQMDQYTQYLMLMKGKELVIMNSYNHSTTSWEEKAFAEDARGPLGGFVWPPRSYSCSFCKREFRSAQALGGHMNVHRRERARLKQSDNPPPNSPPQSSTLSKSLESAIISNPSFVVANSSLSPSRVSSPVLGHGNSFLDVRDDHNRNGVETNFFVGGLSLDFSGSCSNLVDVDEEMEEIDLELRLGDSPKMK